MITIFFAGAVTGVVVGVLFTMGFAAVWAAGDHLVGALLAPGFDAHADQALANSREREVSA